MPKPLVVRAQTDREAFGELYDQTHGMIYRYCRRRVGERTAAEDACGAVFVAIARQMPSFPGKTEADFRRWAFGIARRTTASMSRQTHRRDELFADAVSDGVLTPATPDAPSASIEGAERSDAIDAAILLLPERDQLLIDLRYTEGLSIVDIAVAVGMRQGAVRTALSRAVAQLRRHLLPTEEPTG